MSDGELRDQLVTLLLAGHETTATALAWTFDLLAHQSAAVLERSRPSCDDGERQLPARGHRRVAAAATGAAAGRTPARARAARRPLRAAGGNRRLALDLAPAHARGPLPATAGFPPGALPRGPAPAYGWIPFGGGVRRCIGAAFAELEMRVVISEVLDGARPRARDAPSRNDRPAQPHLRPPPRHTSPMRSRGARRGACAPSAQTSSVQLRPRSSSSSRIRGSAAAVRRHDPGAE